MSKAMLIIDEPECCIDCPCSNFISGYEQWQCKATEMELSEFELEAERPIWCPLRPVPTLKEDNSVIYIERYEGYLEGWNDCVREIIGGDE